MDIDKITEKIKNRIPKPIDIKHSYAVLIPLINNKGTWEIIYEVRANNLKRQPGEISFPGGQLESDETYKEAAIRETIEELNITKENIKIIGELDYLVSYANMTIHCFLATISGVDVDKIEPSMEEVNHIFTVPVDFFLNNEPEVYYLDLQTTICENFPYNLIPNGKKYNFNKGKHSVHFYRYNDYVIWGYTAKMTKHFIDLIKDL